MTMATTATRSSDIGQLMARGRERPAMLSQLDQWKSASKPKSGNQEQQPKRYWIVVDMSRPCRWQVVVVTTTMLAGMAMASDNAAKALPETSIQEQSQAPPQAQSPSEESASQEETSREQKPIFDRRDRIFYPGAAKASLTKIIPEHCARSERHLHQPLPCKSPQCFGLACTSRCDGSIDCQRYSHRECF